MAGIGFELKKVVSKESLSGFLKASVSGIFIVAGPWLLSILSLGIISIFLKNSNLYVLDQFFGILVYIFAISLLLSGGMQYLFTRLFSDYIYDDKIEESLYIILIYLVTTGVVSFVVAWIISSIVIGFSSDNISLIFACSFQSAVINMLWIVLIFVSFLKWYKKILIYFVSGIIFMGVIILVTGINGLDQLIIVYTSGNALTLIALLILSITNYKPKKVLLKDLSVILKLYWKKYKYLYFTGMLYYVTFWIDKILFWIFYGNYIDLLNIKLLHSYDMSMYIANISIIPGMVYFVINSETSFFMKMKKFLISLTLSDYHTINKKKESLRISAHKDILLQTRNQSFITLALCFLSYYIFPQFYIILIFSLCAANFQLIFFTYINYLFYMDRYYSSFLIVLKTTLLNIFLFFIFMVFPLPNIPGLSYLISMGFGCIISYKSFNYDINRLDRYVYAENRN